jgi:hypothetical protein
MRLVDLKPEFMRTTDDRYMCACSYEAAQGVMFLCPRCFAVNGGERGTHTVLLWFAGVGVPEHWRPLPRWERQGSGFEDLTLSPSIDISQPCGWHGFIRNGDVVDA